MRPTKSIELLAPAKDAATAKVAIDWGADAVYMGADRFGARKGAANTIEQIASTVSYAHLFGARVYVTLNTILFDNETEQAELSARKLIDVGVDALIVQDMAYTRMGLEGIELHASTQMCNDTVEGIRFLGECGFSQVVLERNLTATQIAEIAANTSVRLECFVHGAICVCRSGRCFMSRSMNPLRSGNRGDCIQACRLPYTLTDATGRQIKSASHLLSVNDLDLSAHLGELLDMGICSFKIEGRLKDVNYVRSVTGHYRQLIDPLLKQRGLRRSSSGQTVFDLDPQPHKCFSRDAGDYMFEGKTRRVANFDTPKQRGEQIGKIVRIAGNRVTVATPLTLSTADGVSFMVNGTLSGTNINRVEGNTLELNNARGLKAGDMLWRNFDREYNRSLETSRTRRTIDISARFECKGNLASLTLTDSDNNRVESTMECNPTKADNPQKVEQQTVNQLSKSGDTVFNITDTEIVSPVPFIRASELNALRRRALEQLTELRSKQLPHREPFTENRNAKSPWPKIDEQMNVVNRPAESFWRDHGAQEVERGMELATQMAGKVVMTTPYCIRRELGECLKEGSKLQEPLHINNGSQRFSLLFDCKNCQMKVIKDE